jgi:hypothetical protein
MRAIFPYLILPDLILVVVVVVVLLLMMMMIPRKIKPYAT